MNTNKSFGGRQLLNDNPPIDNPSPNNNIKSIK